MYNLINRPKSEKKIITFKFLEATYIGFQGQKLEIFVNFKKTCVVNKCQRDFDEKILNLKKKNSRTILMQTFADILFL